MKLVEFVGHSRGEGWASLASMNREVERLSDGGMGDLEMLAAWGDGGACLGELALSIADLDW
jgi:hypothetical protein